MATVRIYKVAELLNTSSQEVMALLKRDHGIEVKSASSTIEEVVARQFVERLARQRGVALPSGDIFAEGPPVRGGKRPAHPPARKVEPPKPATTLPPPRLVKTIRPHPPAAEAPTPLAGAPVPPAPQIVEAPPEAAHAQPAAPAAAVEHPAPPLLEAPPAALQEPAPHVAAPCEPGQSPRPR